MLLASVWLKPGFKEVQCLEIVSSVSGECCSAHTIETPLVCTPPNYQRLSGHTTLPA